MNHQSDGFRDGHPRHLVDILVAIVFVMGLIAVIDIVWSRFHWRSDPAQDQAGSQGRDEAVGRRSDRQVAATLAGPRPGAQAHDDGGATRHAGHRQSNALFDRAEICARGRLRSGGARQGQDLVALKIREIARENNIPIFEDVALARSMYKQVSVDSVIPSQFYQAVAELVRIGLLEEDRAQSNSMKRTRLVSMNRQPHANSRELIVADAIEPVVGELRLIEVADYVAFIGWNISPACRTWWISAAELYFQPGMLRLGHGGEAHVDWSGSPRIVLDLELRPRGVTVYFQLTLTGQGTSVVVNYVSFEKPGETPEHNTALLEDAIEAARIRRSEPLAFS